MFKICGGRGYVRAMLSLGLLFCAMSSCASANVMWTLTNLSFADGGSATGSFTLDNGGQPVSWNISVQGGNIANFPAVTFVTGEPFVKSNAHFIAFADPTFVRILELGTTSDMTNAGGVIPLNVAFNTLFETVDVNGGPTRIAVSGSLNGVPAVPEPGTSLLGGLGLACAGLLRKRFFAR